MSDWKIKSEENMQSAAILIKNERYTASVHCGYYSIIQLMLHILLNDLGTTKKVNEKSRIGSKEHKEFHKWIQSDIRDKLTDEDDFSVAKKFWNSFTSIKKDRIKADYKNCVTSPREAKKCLDYSKQISELLSENFKI